MISKMYVSSISSNKELNRVVHLTTVHLRNDIRILLKECTALTQAGYDVHLVVADGLGDAVLEGVPVYDVGAKPKSRIKRMWLQPKKAEKKIRELNPSIVHFHDPELLPLGVKLAKKGICVIYDAHEDVPRQNLTKEYIPAIIRPLVALLFEFYENRAIKKLFGVVAATPHIERRFIEQGRTVVNVNNYPILDELVDLNLGEKKTRKKQICYIGAISRLRGVLELIQALPLVPEVRLTLCGNFSGDDFENELRNEIGWSQVDYLGQVDRAAVRQVMGNSFAGVVTFLSAPNHVDAQPNKLFEYMSANLPVVGSHFPLWKKIIVDTGCGVCVDPSSPKAIAHAIHMLLSDPDKVEQMGQAGRDAVLNKYNWSIESKKLITFYDTLCTM